MAALIAAPIVGAVVYAFVLAAQTSGVTGGPTPGELVGTAVFVALIGLAFLVLVLLPFSLLMRRNARFRTVLLVVGGVAWFGFSVLAFVLMGQGADVAASTGGQSLIFGVPMVAVFVALLGKGPHA